MMRVLASSLMLNATLPFDVLAQTTPPAASKPATGQPFNAEQFDALVASIALYPDDLLTLTHYGFDVSARSRDGGALGGGPGTQLAACAGIRPMAPKIAGYWSVTIAGDRRDPSGHIRCRGGG
jgi:hypothetical protein